MRGSVGVWRALDLARWRNLEAAGQPLPLRGGDGVSRRRVLGALVAGAGGMMLPRTPGWARAPKARRVVVVGGGLAGLVALRQLRAMGADATLYEARQAVGGRTRSVGGVFAPDFAFDEGGQLVNADHADMRRLIGDLGLRLIDRNAGGGGREIQIGRNGNAVAESELAEGLRAIAAAIAGDSDRLDHDYQGVAVEIDALSVSAYLDRHGLAPGDVRDALEAGIRTEYGLEPNEASALELLFNLPTVDGHRLTRLSLSDERYLVEGGAGRVAQALAARMGSAIRLGKRLSRVVIEGSGVRLGFADGEEVAADRVVLALPAPLLRELSMEGPLPPLWRELIEVVRLGANEKLIVGYDRQPWHQILGGDGALWSAQGFSEAWDAASSRTGGRDRPGALTYFLGGAQVAAEAGTDNAALRDRFTAMAARVVPELPPPNGRVRRTRWGEDPLAQGAYIGFRPGQLTRFGSLLAVEEQGSARASMAGPLLFAGEWLSDAWPGYMNGAVQTGRIAAAAAVRAEVVPSI
ncbi:NAD(P)/FAD-dependent oxidoreductase [Sphingosinicella sp. BN140058]|uniref:flavin monoamine oxidase family protein n=1 Tax=Sphingosinicella sp. BN140058 TaxID=1892855 RepID=UPI001012EFD3|nr:NAD(P)/FAD-dependent oxidoreductase [Sphingosinicella sp. BN140058]QAY78806.1 FAD-dependent oxidoreductase [Sphingosinicella sp. BN140058]